MFMALSFLCEESWSGSQTQVGHEDQIESNQVVGVCEDKTNQNLHIKLSTVHAFLIKIKLLVKIKLST